MNFYSTEVYEIQPIHLLTRANLTSNLTILLTFLNEELRKGSERSARVSSDIFKILGLDIMNQYLFTQFPDLRTLDAPLIKVALSAHESSAPLEDRDSFASLSPRILWEGCVDYLRLPEEAIPQSSDYWDQLGMIFFELEEPLLLFWALLVFFENRLHGFETFVSQASRSIDFLIENSNILVTRPSESALKLCEIENHLRSSDKNAGRDLLLKWVQTQFGINSTEFSFVDPISYPICRAEIGPVHLPYY